MAVLKVFLGFLMMLGKMRAASQRSLTCLHAAFIQLHRTQMPSKFNESKTFKGHRSRKGYPKPAFHDDNFLHTLLNNLKN